jgi:hypothetical protein
MLGGDRRPVVAGEEHQRVLTQVQLVQFAHHAAKGVVHLRDVAVMGAVGRVFMWIERRVLRIGGDRFVRLMEAHIKEERPRLVAPVQPVQRLVCHQMRRIALQFARRRAVPRKIVRVVMVRIRVVLRGEPVIKAMIAWLRLRGLVELAVHVPFAHMTRRIPGLLQQPGDRDLAAPAHAPESLPGSSPAHPRASACVPSSTPCAKGEQFP